MCLWHERMVSWMWMCCRRMHECMVSGWNECDCVARAPCNRGWKLNCSQLLWSIYIYISYNRIVWERPERKRSQRERERQEREDRNKECPFGRLFSTSLKPTTLHEMWKIKNHSEEKVGRRKCKPQLKKKHSAQIKESTVLLWWGPG